MMENSLAESTRKQYDGPWNTYRQFCQAQNLEPLGESANQLSIYSYRYFIQHITFPECGATGLISYLGYVHTQLNGSVATAYRHLSAVAFNYRLNGRVSPTEDARVGMYMKGLKRLNVNKPVIRATPMTPDVLKGMRAQLATGPTLTKWRTVWRAYMEYHLMLR
jgi:hypothetical protein